MRNGAKIILYFFLLCLLVGALLLLVQKDNISSNLHDLSELTIATNTPLLAGGDQLDLSVLKKPSLPVLVNQVINFNFDNICWRPDVVSQTEPTDNTASSTQPSGSCRPGNNLPFIVNKAN
jgi:hypothetical protein